MSKTITSPVKKWPGTVVLSDPMTIPQVIAFEEAISEAKTIEPTNTRYGYAIAKGICKSVETWNLEGLGILTEENFPGSPKLASMQLLTWLIGEVTKVYKDADEIPNA